jgi:hypothetical protein
MDLEANLNEKAPASKVLDFNHKVPQKWTWEMYLTNLTLYKVKKSVYSNGRIPISGYCFIR